MTEPRVHRAWAIRLGYGRRTGRYMGERWKGPTMLFENRREGRDYLRMLKSTAPRPRARVEQVLVTIGPMPPTSRRRAGREG